MPRELLECIGKLDKAMPQGTAVIRANRTMKSRSLCRVELPGGPGTEDFQSKHAVGLAQLGDFREFVLQQLFHAAIIGCQGLHGNRGIKPPAPDPP